MSLNNSSKRKTRPPSNTNSKPPRVKGPPERSSNFDGVYGNARFMHSAASLVGCIVHVQVKNGTTYEGVFTTFSQQLDIVLEMVNRADRKNLSCNSINSLFASFHAEDSICDKMIFKLSDIVMISAVSVDLDFATRDGSAEVYQKPQLSHEGFTDTSISKYNGPMPERELEPWEAPVEDGEGVVILEGEEEKNGWDVNEMFRTNAEKYNVKSTYDSALPEYTIQLEPKNTDEYKKQEAKASKLANEIESSPAYRTRTNVENGDEEDKYSAVLRPVDNTPMNKYAVRKRNIPGNKNMRSTPPPSSLHHGGKNQQSGGGHYAGPAMHSPSGTPTHAMPYNKMVSNSLPGGNQSSPHSNHGGHLGPHPGVKNLQQQMGAHGGGRPNSPRHSMGAPVSTPPLVGVMVGHGPPPNAQQPQAPVQEIYAEDKLEEDGKVPGTEEALHLAASSSAKQQTDKRDLQTNKGMPTRGRDEQIAEFKKFSSDFKLSEDPKCTKDGVFKEEDYDSLGGSSGGETGGRSVGSYVGKDEDASKDSSLEGEEGGPLLSPSEQDKGGTLKKSTLNPNAKAFTPMAPHASVDPVAFHHSGAVYLNYLIQRAGPVATPPSGVGVSGPPPRLHTQSPIMAVPQQLMQGLGQPQFTTMGPQYVMSASPGIMSLTPPFATATVTPTHRFRKVPMQVQPRHDFSQSVHVAAATGQPILAPAGIPTPPQLTVQYTHAQGMVPTHGHHHAHHHHHHHQALAYQQVPSVPFQMYPVQMGPRVMSPQSVSLVPTSHAGSYGDPHHMPQVFMSHAGAAAALQASHAVSVSAVAANMVPQQQQQQQQQQQGGQVPPNPSNQQQQQGGPMHTAPSPVHQQGGQGPPTPSQTPTPTGGHPVSTPQPVVYHHGQMQHPSGQVPTSQQLHLSHQHHFAVLMHQQVAQAAAAAAAASGVPQHGHGGAMPSSSPHVMQGLQGGPPPSAGHLGTPTHVISHPTMVIPTSAAMVHANPFVPSHPHQARDRGRQHTGNR